MIEEIHKSANQWKQANPEVEVERLAIEDGELVEITWEREIGGTAYIDLFPEEEDAVIAQHGTYKTPDQREPCGVTRIRLVELRPNLDRLKHALAAVQPRPWSYQPTVDIGVVSSLKFH